MEALEQQEWVLKALKAGQREKILFELADNITRANYADFLWPEWSVCFRAHFMFHTPKENNGFSNGEHEPETKDIWIRHDIEGNPMGHCCYCQGKELCANFRVEDAKRAHEKKLLPKDNLY